jgi:hypothetical protein
VRAVLDEAAGLMQLVDSSDRPERATHYRPLNLSLAYETEAATGRELVRARPQLCRGGARFQPVTRRSSCSRYASQPVTAFPFPQRCRTGRSACHEGLDSAVPMERKIARFARALERRSRYVMIAGRRCRARSADLYRNNHFGTVRWRRAGWHFLSRWRPNPALH